MFIILLHIFSFEVDVLRNKRKPVKTDITRIYDWCLNKKDTENASEQFLELPIDEDNTGNEEQTEMILKKIIITTFR